jgi:hypothetical protein
MANLMSMAKAAFKDCELSLIDRKALENLKHPKAITVDVIITTAFDCENPCVSFIGLKLSELPKTLSIIKPELLQSCFIYLNVENNDSTEIYNELLGTFNADGILRLESLSFVPKENEELNDHIYTFITDREELQTLNGVYDYLRSLDGMKDYMY